jgi:isocitrate dehydrogenase (NAD+)
MTGFSGKNVANPTALLLSTSKMLDHIGLVDYAAALRGGVEKVLADKKIRTRDIGGHATSRQFTKAVTDAC